jgi:hypothetical protein
VSELTQAVALAIDWFERFACEPEDFAVREALEQALRAHQALAAKAPAVLQAAHDEISRLCVGPDGVTSKHEPGRDWTLSIPVHPTDSDCVFLAVVELAEQLL